jgi:hypothetical protein
MGADIFLGETRYINNEVKVATFSFDKLPRIEGQTCCLPVAISLACSFPRW